MDTKEDLTSSQFDTFDDIYRITLRQLLECGVVVQAGPSLSIGANRQTHELLNYSVTITNPQCVLLCDKRRKFNLPTALARFCWMMAGNESLSDIAFYEPKVGYFTDDGETVPGSNYGKRILKAGTNINQLLAAIERIKEDKHTRRAAISIFQPEDSFRKSRDIPCAFGVFYNLRDGELHATTVMRSMNVFSIFPYNVLEFTLLAKIVACELQASLGSITITSVSAHLFEEDVDKALEVLEHDRLVEAGSSVKLPDMPESPSPLGQVSILSRLEERLRTIVNSGDKRLIRELIGEVEQGSGRINGYSLAPFWMQFYYVFMYYILTVKLGSSGKSYNSEYGKEALLALIEHPWSYYLGDEEGLPTPPKPPITNSESLVATA